MNRNIQLSLAFFAVAALIMLHQYVTWGVWFEIKDIHHEMFVVAFAFAGGILLYVNKWRLKK